MKKLLLLGSMLTMVTFAAEWTGAISEAGCGLKHAKGGGEACVTSCVKRGAAPVFVANDKVIKIANTDKVMDFLGKKVTVTGTLEGDTVTIETVKAAD